MNLYSSDPIYRDRFLGSGSIGGFFTFGGPDIFGITNVHVISNSKNLKVNDPIFKSGSRIIIGSLYYWVNLNPDINYLDIALFKLQSNQNLIWRLPSGVIQPAGIRESNDNENVYMVLRNGQIKKGQINNSSISFSIPFPIGDSSYQFSRLIEIEPINDSHFSERGDSGNLIYSEDDFVLGVLMGTNVEKTKSYAIPFINGSTGIKELYDLEIWLPA